MSTPLIVVLNAGLLELWFDQHGPPDCNPARVQESGCFSITLEPDGGTAAGGLWRHFNIKDCVDESLIGKRIDCHIDGYDGDYEVMSYSAEMTWDDGFIANTTDETLGYREYDEPDGTGSPMGGEVIDDLDGMRFMFVPNDYKE